MASSLVSSALLLLALLCAFSFGPAAVVAQFVPVSASTSTVYTASVRATPAPIAFTPFSPNLSLVDDGVDTLVPLGFSFIFYNVSYQTINVGANGNLQFITSSTSNSAAAFGFLNAAPTPFIALLYSDLYPETVGGRTYATIGTAPNRQFILRYTNVPFYNSGPGLTADVLLTETTNTVELRYYSVPTNSRTADIGIQNSIQGGSYDYIAVANNLVVDNFFVANTTGYAFTFTPIRPFVNSPVWPAGPTSTVYTATVAATPAQATFTAQGTLPYTNDDVTGVSLGFGFTYYNVTYQTVFIAADGNIQFTTGLSTKSPSGFGSILTGGTAVTPYIAFYWADLNPTAAPASRTYATLGTAPNRQFILRYSNVIEPAATGVFTGDVILYETSNQIELRYYSVPYFTSIQYNVDIGIAGGVLGYIPDFLSVVDQGLVTPIAANYLTAHSFVFAPITPFVNPPLFQLPALTSTNSSRYYTAVVQTAPAAISFTAMGTLPFTNDDVSYVPLGFSFTFYNVSYSAVFVAANGNIQFSTASSTATVPTLGNTNTATTPFIAFFWADLQPTAAPASRTYATLGTAPNRQFIVRYSNVPESTVASDQSLSCDVLLYETTNTVEIRYYQVPAFSVSSAYYVDVGIQSSAANGGNDYVAILSRVNPTTTTAFELQGQSVFFTPKQPFLNPTSFSLVAPVPTTTSTVYTATTGTAPAQVAFTPAATLPYTADDVSYVPLGFNFTFYKINYGAVFVGANGNIQFSTASLSQYPSALGTSSSAALSPFIAFFWSGNPHLIPCN